MVWKHASTGYQTFHTALLLGPPADARLLRYCSGPGCLHFFLLSTLLPPLLHFFFRFSTSSSAFLTFSSFSFSFAFLSSSSPSSSASLSSSSSCLLFFVFVFPPQRYRCQLRDCEKSNHVLVSLVQWQTCFSSLPDSNFTRRELLPDESTTARLRGTHINANVVISFSLSLRCGFIIVVIIMIVIIWVDKCEQRL